MYIEVYLSEFAEKRTPSAVLLLNSKEIKLLECRVHKKADNITVGLTKILCKWTHRHSSPSPNDEENVHEKVTQ